MKLLQRKINKYTGLTIFLHYLFLLTDFLSHSLPLHLSWTHNSTLLFSPKYCTSLYHLRMNEGELALHKNIQQNKLFNLVLNLTGGDKSEPFPWRILKPTMICILSCYCLFLISIFTILIYSVVSCKVILALKWIFCHLQHKVHK